MTLIGIPMIFETIFELKELLNLITSYDFQIR